MATLYTEQSKNVTKTWILMLTFLGLIIGIGFVFARIYDDARILFLFAIFAVFMNFFSFWFSDKIAIRLSKAKPADPNQYRDLHNIVENLAITAGLPKPRVYIIEDNSPNAFATGRNKEHSAVAVTTGLLAILDRTELEGVIAHELAHIGNRDILISTIAVVLAGFVSIIADWFLRAHIFGGGGDRDNKASGVLVLVGVALSILAPIFATLIQFAISRKREFLADASGALLTRYPEGLARALEKISSSHTPMKNPHQATAHLFIANPFGGKSLRNLFSTHPPVEERVKALREKAY